MSDFMEPTVAESSYYIVETTNGTWFVNVDTSGIIDDYDELCDYVEGSISSKEFQSFDAEGKPELKKGFIAYMSAPGYLDRTDECAFDTELEAWEYLIEYYGDESDDESDDSSWETYARERIEELKREQEDH